MMQNSRIECLPTDPYCEGSLVPISTCDDWHFAVGVGARPVKDLVRVAMFCGIDAVVMAVSIAIVAMRVRCRHFL